MVSSIVSLPNRGENLEDRVDYTHPTAAELLCDFVVGDGLADHVSSQIDYRNELR